MTDTTFGFLEATMPGWDMVDIGQDEETRLKMHIYLVNSPSMEYYSQRADGANLMELAEPNVDWLKLRQAYNWCQACDRLQQFEQYQAYLEGQGLHPTRLGALSKKQILTLNDALANRDRIIQELRTLRTHPMLAVAREQYPELFDQDGQLLEDQLDAIWRAKLRQLLEDAHAKAQMRILFAPGGTLMGLPETT